MTKTLCSRLLAILASALVAAAALADEVQIRKNLGERLPKLPRIDEVSRSPVPGLWEVRMGGDIAFTDEQGNFLITGPMYDTRSGVNLTEAKLDKLFAIDFDKLPVRDFVTIRQGSGARRIVVFEDPNCSFCRRFEGELAALKDVTIHVILFPILGPDSLAKSRAIWCAKDPAKAWRAWMLEGRLPPVPAAGCDSSALERNVAFGKRRLVQSTPTSAFADGSKLAGAAGRAEVEQRLQRPAVTP